MLFDVQAALAEILSDPPRDTRDFCDMPTPVSQVSPGVAKGAPLRNRRHRPRPTPQSNTPPPARTGTACPAHRAHGQAASYPSTNGASSRTGTDTGRMVASGMAQLSNGKTPEKLQYGRRRRERSAEKEQKFADITVSGKVNPAREANTLDFTAPNDFSHYQ